MAEQIQAWQTIFLLLIEYTVFVLGTGAFVFRKRISGKGFVYGVLVSLVMGNILCINLVFAAYVIHCYKRWGIFLLWLLLILWSWLWPIRKSVPARVEYMAEAFRKLLEGEYGVRLVRKNLFRSIGSFVKRAFITFLKRCIFPHGFEILFVCGIMLFNIWYNSYQAIYFGGIGVPDVSVHTEWIQKMREGNIFGNGIYPFGFHCIVYLMITLFGNKIIPVMSFFALVQDFWIFLLLYLLMRKIFRFPGTAVIGFFVFSVLGISVNYRYQFTLPQEYGMIGLYPAILFLWMYLEQKKVEIRTQKIKPERGDSLEARRLVRRLNRKVRLREKGANELAWYFGFSVALTFMCHFYITIACFFLCAGLVLFYPITIVRRKCFWPLFASVFLCMVMALTPMVGWYATGKPLEGSLNWAIGVISGEEQEEDEAENQANTEQEEAKEGMENGSGQKENTDKETGSDIMSEEDKFWNEIAEEPLLRKVYEAVKRICEDILEKEKGKLLFFSVLAAAAYSCILILFKKRRGQGKMILGLCAYLIMLLIMARASWFGLPNLMEQGRLEIFIDYIAGVFFACPLEIVCGWLASVKWVRLLVSLGIYVFNGLLIIQTVEGNQVKPLSLYYIVQYKAALDITEQIMEEYEDRTWTIVSPVDELPFIRLNGYHYEWLEFLAKEAKYKKTPRIDIPTKYVFFYIEKKPIDYAKAVYMDSGKPKYDSISEKAADTIFNEKEVFSSGLYQSHRNIIESKAYYWAKTYASYFPREMTVYYEDDDFVCYRLVQDPYSLNNLSIDFGYNVGKYKSEVDVE